MDDELRQRLAELSRTLHEALAESPEVGRKLEQIRQEGYALYLLIDANRRGKERIPIDDTSWAGAVEKPTFRINSQDLAFLRSIGIDPTRSVKRRSGTRARSEQSP